MISIHALVKRATTWSDCGLGLTYISIHALVKRATVSTFWHSSNTLRFQSTPS